MRWMPQQESPAHIIASQASHGDETDMKQTTPRVGRQFL